MKAEDLMIGDWVFDKPVSDKPVQVIQINEKRVVYKHNKDFISSGVENLEPVPLTQEILEKNGFTRFARTNWHVDTYRPFYLDNPSNPNNYKDNYWLRVGDCMNRIEYVHELQHALRLCCINHEIIL